MIAVQNLTKRYGQHLAVDNISFTVNKGEIVGFLGPNGAGKTTTMNILTGFISATSGDAIINGHNILDAPEKAKSCIGYLPDLPPLYNHMSVDEYLNFVAEIRKVPKHGRKQMIDEVKEIVKVTDHSKRICGNLSKGYRQRVGLAQALVGYPEVLIFDEPTNGFDPKQIIEMRQVIKDLGKSHTLIISSHILTEVAAMCDRILIIHHGQIVASDTTSRLSTALAKGTKMKARIKGRRDQIQEAFSKVSILRKVEATTSREAGTFDFEFIGDEGVDIREAIFACAKANNLPLLMLASAELTLEEIFLQVTAGGRDNSEKGGDADGSDN